jgi:hypothetical protein
VQAWVCNFKTKPKETGPGPLLRQSWTTHLGHNLQGSNFIFTLAHQINLLQINLSLSSSTSSAWLAGPSLFSHLDFHHLDSLSTQQEASNTIGLYTFNIVYPGNQSQS